MSTITRLFRDRSSHRSEPAGLLDPLAPESESLRMLRTGIRFSSIGGSVRTILVTSAGPRVGKSMIAANLAMSLAQVNERTLLVDADLRRPTVHRIFDLPRSSGLTSALARGGHLAHVVPNAREGLDVLPAGPLPPNPSELLSSAQMNTLFAELTISHDSVVIDAPPVLLATEAAVLASLVDGVIFVVDLQVSRRREVARALDLLDRTGARVLGTCVNRYGRALRRDSYY
jgi:capsular exopolysaccharide synthesis family protein